MGGRTKKTINCLAVLGLCLTLLFAFSCSSSNRETTFYNPISKHYLTFESLWPFSRTNSAIESTPIYISVASTAESPLPNKWEYSSSQIPGEIDYSKNFLIVASMGFRSVTGPKITIQNIWQERQIIYVQALFNEAGPTYLPLYSEPTAVVKVSKEKMTQFGEITFILLDQNGNTKASTTSEILK